MGAFLAAPAFAAKPERASADLDQCANGGIGPPIEHTDPCDWVNGNLNQHSAHYTMGESIPYRIVLDGLAAGTHTLEIGFDIKHSGKHAIDYLTSPQRIAETVDPCVGIAGCALTGTFPTPAPAATPQPLASFNNLTAAEREFWTYGATITSATYLVQGDLNAAQSEATVTITFTATGSSAVIAWGGHIASEDDWGAGNGAANVNGSPYHMRLHSLDGTGGNQDRSLQDSAVAPIAEPLGASLTVVKQVVNDAGGQAVPADFLLHLRDAQGQDVNGSPQPGDPFGSSYVGLPAGNYSVTEDLAAGYAAAFSGDCAADGSVTLLDGDTKTCVVTNDDIQARLTVTKVVVNDNGGTATAAAFTLQVGNATVQSGVAAGFLPGTYTVSESGPAGYAGAFSGDCDAQGQVTLANGDDLACTLTNDDIRPILTVTKVVVNDDGGTLAVADFPLQVDGSPATSGAAFGIDAGTHTVTEAGDPGYAATFSGDCDAEGRVSLAVGDAKSCTLTNDDIRPLLTVVKVVVNDNGGTAIVEDAALFVDGASVASGQQAGYAAGSHQVSEVGPFGYAPSFGGDCAADGTITLALADVKTCIVTNDDIQPILTVTKLVVNDNGGELGVPDFPLFVDATGVLSGNATGFDAAAYTVSETGSAAYAAAIAGDCAADGSIALAVGEAKSCTVTNDDVQPVLTVVKVVVNDNGGQATVGDFRLSVGNQSVLSGAAHGFDAGLYALAEDGPAGYAATWGGDCAADGTVTLAVGDTKTCVLTNDDIQPILTVTKVVVNDDGGTLAATDWSLFVGATQVASGAATGFDAAAYHLSEAGPFGYALRFEGDCDADGNLTLAVGDVKACTMVNDDIRPELRVTKEVVNDNGGTATAADWTFAVGATPVALGNWTGFPAGAHAVSELGPAGYALSFAGDCDANGTVLLAIGVRSECRLTNDDVQPILTVTKVVVNDDGGAAVVADWALFVDLTAVASGASHGFDASALPFQLYEAGPAGYALSFAGDCDANGTVELRVGDVKACTMVNDDIRPILTVTKVVVDDNGGVATVADWTFHVGATQVQSGAANGFPAAAYLVTEDGPAGYAASFAGDCDANGTVELRVGDVKECLLTNDDIQPILTVTKVVVNDDGGAAAAADWDLFVGLTQVTSGLPYAFDAAAYQLSEAGPAGYALSFAGDCDANGRVELLVGDVKECLLTNDDQPAILHVIKHVINDGLGNATAGDFDLQVTGSGAGPFAFAGAEAPGVTVTLDAGAYQVAELGAPNYIVTYDGCAGTLANGEERTCTVTNNDPPVPTRTQGFWSTHTAFTRAIFAAKLGGSMAVGAPAHQKLVDADGKLFGAWYADIAKMTSGGKRTVLDQARMILAQQLVTAKLNCAAFGCTAATLALIATADAAYAGSNAAAIIAASAALDAYNNGGDSIAMPSGLPAQGSGTPALSKQLANKAFWNAP